MSRTRKGRKGPGYEYGSKRGSAAGIDYAGPGSWAKKVTHRFERRDGKEVVKVEQREGDNEE